MLISVVIPTYNRGAAIRPTIESALAQDLPPEAVELIVVDDGSTDDTAEFLRENYGDNPRVRLFSMANGGVARARNFGLDQARGEFIAYLDHDDLWLPSKLRLQLEKMRSRPRVGLVHCNWLAVNETGDAMPPEFQITQQKWWKFKSGRAYPWVLMPHPLQCLRNPMPSMSYPLLRTQTVRDVGGFDPKVVPLDDWDLWIRLSHICEFAYVPEVLVRYVFHSNQQHLDSAKAYDSCLALSDKHPINPRKNPYLAFKMVCFRRICQNYRAYHAAKLALTQRSRARVLLFWLRALWARPDKAATKYWIYLLLRAARGNFAPF